MKNSKRCTGELTGRPSVWSTISAEESVLLLETKPRLFSFCKLENFVRMVSEVHAIRGSISIVRLAKDQLVGFATVRVIVHGNRAQPLTMINNGLYS